jgi:hypothetical protein
MDITGMLLLLIFVGIFIYAIFQIMLFYDMNSSDYMPYTLFFIFLVISAGVLPNKIYAQD